VGLKGLIST